MNEGAIALAAGLGSVVLLAFLGWIPRRGERSPRARWCRLFLLVAACIVTLAVYGSIVSQVLRVPAGYLRVWNITNHYMGTKYFEEVGYFDLYDALLEADEELFRTWPPDAMVRNLRTYEIAPRRPPDVPVKSRFSPERWLEFKKDFERLQRLTFEEPGKPLASAMPGTLMWPYFLTDKGMNVSPVWMATCGLLVRVVSPDDATLFKLITTFDGVLLLLALGLVAYAFGWEKALLVLIFLVTFWGSYGRLMGNFLQYAWLASLLAGFSFWKLDRVRTSAVFFSYPVMVMGFVAFLPAGVFLGLAWALLVARARGTGVPNAETSSRRVFLVWFTAACVLWFLSTLVLPGPIETWRGFFAKISLHGAYLYKEMYNVGLKNLIATFGKIEFARGFIDSDHLAERQWLYYPLLVGLVGLWVFACLRRKLATLELMVLGFAPIFALFVLSRYYYIALAVLLLLDRHWRTSVIVLIGVNLGMYLGENYLAATPETHFYPYWGVQVVYLLFFVTLLLPWRGVGRQPSH